MSSSPLFSLGGSSYQCLINISSGLLAQLNVKIDKAVEIGTEQLIQLLVSWSDGFYSTLLKQVVTYARKNSLRIGENAIIDQEAIYARVIDLLVSQSDLDVQEVLATELTAYPPKKK